MVGPKAASPGAPHRARALASSLPGGGTAPVGPPAHADLRQTVGWSPSQRARGARGARAPAVADGSVVGEAPEQLARSVRSNWAVAGPLANPQQGDRAPCKPLAHHWPWWWPRVAAYSQLMRIRIVDAFTDRPFSGNPAAVVLFPAGPFPADDWLAQVAAEVNLSETAFAHPLPDAPDADWALRWFTPTTEVAMCGHATLATAHVLHTTGAATGTVRFATRSGVLTATTPARAANAEDRPAPPEPITLDFPTAPLTPVEPPHDLRATLGAEVLRCYDTGPQLGDLLVELADEATVRRLAPDLTAVARLPHRGLIVTAAAQRPGADYDYVSRFFGPAVGTDEDPVTGSAHTALAPLWTSRTGRAELTGFQVSARGGRVLTRLRDSRTLLTGAAVTVIDGELLTAPVTAPAAN